MKKNINVEIIRAIALLSVLIYHIQCLFNGQIVSNRYITSIINFGGEIGVTLFFIISGYGIFKSIDYKKNNNDFEYKTYIKKRFLKIAPAYYFCIFICLTLTGSAIYLSKSGIFDIFTHLTFTHNFFVKTHGSINGVLWTMGTFMQFYLIAPFLYDYIKNKTYLKIFSIVIFTII